MINKQTDNHKSSSFLNIPLIPLKSNNSIHSQTEETNKIEAQPSKSEQNKSFMKMKFEDILPKPKPLFKSGLRGVTLASEEDGERQFISKRRLTIADEERPQKEVKQKTALNLSSQRIQTFNNINSDSIFQSNAHNQEQQITDNNFIIHIFDLFSLSEPIKSSSQIDSSTRKNNSLSLQNFLQSENIKKFVRNKQKLQHFLKLNFDINLDGAIDVNNTTQQIEYFDMQNNLWKNIDEIKAEMEIVEKLINDKDRTQQNQDQNRKDDLILIGKVKRKRNDIEDQEENEGQLEDECKQKIKQNETPIEKGKKRTNL